MGPSICEGLEMSADKERENSSIQSAAPDEAVPICAKCCTPYSRGTDYCKNCGATVGQYTAYIPFTNIRFFANFYGRLWTRVWYEQDIALSSRLFCMLLILLLAPIMLLGLPIVYWQRRQIRTKSEQL